MRIALLSEKYTPDVGGLAISVARLAQLVSAAGHTVHVFAPSPGLEASEARSLEQDGVTITRFGSHKRTDDTLVHWFDLLVREHRHTGFDLFHAYFATGAGFVAAHAGVYCGVPSVVSARGNDIDRAVFDPARAAHVLHALQRAAAVTANSSDLVTKIKALVPDRDVELIPNGVDAEFFCPRVEEARLADSLSLSASSPVLGFVGELREKKGLRALLSAYAQVNERRPATLLIVGDVRRGDDESLFAQLQSSIPNARILVTGFVNHSDLPSYYALMDIFLHPSLRDGLPNALLEAMACEKAVVATPAGGIFDAIRDRSNGRLAPIGDADALSHAIIDLLDDPKTASAYAQAARETVLREFTLESELEKYLNLYKRLV